MWIKMMNESAPHFVYKKGRGQRLISKKITFRIFFLGSGDQTQELAHVQHIL